MLEWKEPTVELAETIRLDGVQRAAQATLADARARVDALTKKVLE